MQKIERNSRWVNRHHPEHVLVREVTKHTNADYVSYVDHEGMGAQLRDDNFLRVYEPRLDWIKRTRHGRSFGVSFKGKNVDRAI